MKNYLYAALACFTLCLSAPLSARAADDEKSELEGVWQQTRLVVDGEEKPVAADARLTIRGNTSTLKANGKVVFSGVFKLNSQANPKRSEGTYSDGPNKGKSASTIYKIDGDKVTFCRGPVGAPLPTEFVCKPGSGGLLSEYKRVEK